MVCVGGVVVVALQPLLSINNSVLLLPLPLATLGGATLDAMLVVDGRQGNFFAAAIAFSIEALKLVKYRQWLRSPKL